jgi:hypothetical protein
MGKWGKRRKKWAVEKTKTRKAIEIVQLMSSLFRHFAISPFPLVLSVLSAGGNVVGVARCGGTEY